MNAGQLSENRKLLPLRSFAKDGPYTLAYLSNLVQRKKLKAKKIGRNYFSSRQWFSEYLEKHGRMDPSEKAEVEPINRELLPLRQFAKEGPYNLAYLSNLVQRKKLKAKKIGRNYFSTREWFGEYLKNHSQDRVLKSTAIALFPQAGIGGELAPGFNVPSAIASAPGNQPGVSGIRGSGQASAGAIDLDDLSDKIASKILTGGAEAQAAVKSKARKKRKSVLLKILPKSLAGRLSLASVLAVYAAYILATSAPVLSGHLAKAMAPAYLYPYIKISKIIKYGVFGQPENPPVGIEARQAVAGEKIFAEKKSFWNPEIFIAKENEIEEEACQAGDYFRSEYRRLAGWAFNGGKNIYLSFLELINPVEFKESLAPEKLSEKKEESGAVVVPYKSKEQADEIKQKVDTMFSDPVEVSPDPSGRSGIIKPVFGGEPGRDSYLYMMVPVAEDEPKK
ncbi:MAG: hypothetical protein WCW77_03820 [Patescibacteria group bacterium]|jgi:hypothetical protein